MEFDKKFELHKISIRTKLKEGSIYYGAFFRIVKKSKKLRHRTGKMLFLASLSENKKIVVCSVFVRSAFFFGGGAPRPNLRNAYAGAQNKSF